MLPLRRLESALQDQQRRNLASGSVLPCTFDAREIRLKSYEPAAWVDHRVSRVCRRVDARPDAAAQVCVG